MSISMSKSRRPTKHLRPARDNRAEAVDLIVKGMAATADQFRSDVRMAEAKCREDIAARRTGRASVPAALSGFHGMGVAVHRVLEQDPTGWSTVKQYFARIYLAQELNQHDWVVSKLGFNVSTSIDAEIVYLHSLALAGGADEIAEWTVHFLHNLFHGGGARSGIRDQDFFEFYWELIAAQLTEEWPKPSRLSASLGHFRPLLETASSPADFAAALIDYCDFRLSRAFQFESPDSARPRKPSDPMYLFEQQWFAIFPLELLALQAVYRKATGRELSLIADHPLLQTPLMSVPSMLPLAEDILTGELRSLGAKTFGAAWKPLTPIDLTTA
jgi:hypothetical protein